MLRSESAHRNPPKEVNEFSEWKLGLIGLVFSLFVITCKLIAHNRDFLRDLLVEENLMRREVLLENGEIMYRNMWAYTLKYSNVWLPPLCGVLTMYFTWIMVYLDSEMPGVQPPSPLSPSKYKLRSGHTFHLNYVFAFIMGIMVTAYMYFKDVKFEY